MIAVSLEPGFDSLEAMIKTAAFDADLWVFGYGSLMWQPGFDFAERQTAIVRGYHRALCVYSHVHRGTPEQPGLVLGLDRGGSCKGVAFRVAAPAAEGAVSYLRRREQVTRVYRELLLPARLADGRHVTALTYVVDRGHAQYAGALDRHALARFVGQGHGISGANCDYICSTQAHLAQLGIRDATLEWLVRHIDAAANERLAACTAPTERGPILPRR